MAQAPLHRIKRPAFFTPDLHYNTQKVIKHIDVATYWRHARLAYGAGVRKIKS